MNDAELDRLLKRAAVPERAPDYWRQFPGRVIEQMQRQRSKNDLPSHVVAGTPRRGWNFWVGNPVRRWPAWSFGLATACILMGLAFWIGRARSRSEFAQVPAARLTTVRTYLREIEALFPNQVRAIVIDSSGPHLRLADSPEVPALQPVYVRICGPTGCLEYITFSGQQIQLNGQLCDVLLERGGGVLVVGPDSVWSSSAPGEQSGSYRIAARVLGENS